ncbi:very short patch repair endonuclease [Mesorhizobium sp. SARCC-RB16n]|nr:very short patch repair endonuclease [Mesorhizobium sp. SARCC-RB16n]
MTDSVRSRNMAAIRGKDTVPELRVRRFLYAQGLRYRLHAGGLPGKPDLVFRSRYTVVFVHGCFWHGCPHCRTGRRTVKSNAGYWTPKLERNKARDTRVRAELKGLGWRVFVIWECQTKDQAALGRLVPELRDQPSSGSSPCTASGPGPE